MIHLQEFSPFSLKSIGVDKNPRLKCLLRESENCKLSGMCSNIPRSVETTLRLGKVLNEKRVIIDGIKVKIF